MNYILYKRLISSQTQNLKTIFSWMWDYIEFRFRLQLLSYQTMIN